MTVRAQITSAAAPVGRNPSMTLALFRDIALLIFITQFFTTNLFQLFIDVRQVPDSGVIPKGDIISQIMVSAFLVGGIYWHFVHHTSLTRLLSLAWPLLPLIIFVLCSVLWSSFPDVSLRRAIRLAMEVGGIILFAAAYSDTTRLLRVLFLSFALILVLDLAFLSIPSISYTHIGYAGVHTEKNQTGAFCFFAIPLFVLAVLNPRIFPSRIISLALAILAVGILVISQSKTAMGALFIVPSFAVCFIALSRLGPLASAVMMVIITLTGAIIFAVLASTDLNALLDVLIGDSSFTGRDQVWRYALNQFWQSPLVGYGYGSLWHIGESQNPNLRTLGFTAFAGQAHNGYLDIMAQLGVIGLALTSILLTVIVYRLWLSTRYNQNIGAIFYAMCLTFGILLYNITESTLVRSGSEGWLLFLLVTSAVYMNNCLAHTSRRSRYAEWQPRRY